MSRTTTQPEPPTLTLSDEQRAAVEHDAGPLIVLAGPGTGKTRVITARVAHMVRERGVDPATILAVTFTNKAAEELRERIGALLDPVTARAVNAGTMHAYGMGLLRRFGDMLGLPPELKILDEAQIRRLARELIRANGLYRMSIGRGIDHAVEHGLRVAHELVSAGVAPREALTRIDRAAQDLSSDGSSEARARRAELTIAREGAALAGLLDDACLERGVARYDDLIAWPMLLLRRSPLAADIVRQQCRHVVVDEFQDFNATQIAWLAALCPPKSGPDLCVVGDDDQSIYGFRGADERAFDRFADQWPGSTTLRLTTNYRSGEAIVGASNAVIARAGYRFDDSKFGVAGPGVPEGSAVELVRISDDLRVGETAAAMIRARLDEDPALDLGEIAIIARTNRELLRACDAMEALGIPFTCSTPGANPEDPGVRTVLAWAALAVDPTRTWAARAVLTRPPFSLDAPTIATLDHRYRTARAWANANPGEEEPGPFIAWLSAHAPAATEDALRRAAEIERDIAEFAAATTADHALMHIVRLTGAAQAEALAPRERAVRVRAIIGLLRFARERLDRLDEPRGLRELLAYIDDLPDKDKLYAATPESTVAGANEPDTAGPGVRMLTAHASKGLEFDTVYLLRCSSPHGFPSPGAEASALPEGVLDPDPQGRPPRARRDDEERRIFFVALTRAKRRAVLLAKVPKKTSAINYPLELLADLGPGLIEHDEADVAPPGLADGLAGMEIEAGTAGQRSAMLAAERRAARRDAAAALDLAETRDEPDDALAERLRAAAERLAVIRAVERTGRVPRWAKAAGLDELGDRLAERLRKGETPVPVFPPIDGPMRLSYSAISQYLKCPRCYYIDSVLEMPQESSDAMSLGTTIHSVLQSFGNAWSEADNEGRQAPGWDELEAETRRRFMQDWPRHTEFDPEQLERAVAMSRIFFEQLHPQNAHILHVEQKFEMPFEVDGVVHTITGKIDRIDQDPGGGCRLIDYKTGYPTKELREPKKSDLQMGIYVMALPALKIEPGPGSVCEYWMLASGDRGTIGFDRLEIDKTREKIAKVIRGMAAGEWHKGSDTACSGFCDFLDGPQD
ncbi:MAG: ATP-dependent helicase [Phycisphaerales bacterium]|nr:ATP-dependent helicase [Planctomycetota bacterium]MCH8509957.1 ATP-dependent helicase [Phycisphaerales bacterium]